MTLRAEAGGSIGWFRLCLGLLVVELGVVHGSMGEGASDGCTQHTGMSARLTKAYAMVDQAERATERLAGYEKHPFDPALYLCSLPARSDAR